jgi:hypothetical protein
VVTRRTALWHLIVLFSTAVSLERMATIIVTLSKSWRHASLSFSSPRPTTGAHGMQADCKCTPHSVGGGGLLRLSLMSLLTTGQLVPSPAVCSSNPLKYPECLLVKHTKTPSEVHTVRVSLCLPLMLQKAQMSEKPTSNFRQN